MASSEIHPSRWRAGRGGIVPNLIVVHTSEGSYGPGAAEALKRWMAGPDNVASYHRVVDTDSCPDLVSEADTAYGAGGVNQRSLHMCVAGRAASIAWGEFSGTAGGHLMADQVADWCRRYGIPAVHLTPEQVRDGAPGICGHGDVSVYHPTSQGHTDPGTGFPWSLFITSVRDRLHEEEAMPAGDLIGVRDHPHYPPTTEVVYVTDGYGVAYRWIQNEADLAGVRADREARGQATNIIPRRFAELGRYGVLIGPAP